MMFLVFVIPVGIVNGYIPYLIIGIVFVGLIISNHYHIECNGCFFIFTVYMHLTNILMSCVFTDYDIFYVLRSSLFLLVPFMAIQFGKIYARHNWNIDFVKFSMILLFVELVFAIIQHTNNTVGALSSLYFGSEKYYITYIEVGHVLRSIGTFGNPNSLGTGVLICLALILNLSDDKKNHVLALVMATIIVLCCRSRTAILSEALLLFIYYVKPIEILRGRMKIKDVIKPFLLILILLILFQLYSQYVGREIFSRLELNNSRLYVWRELLSTSESYSPAKKVLSFFFGTGVSNVKSMEDADNEFLFIYLSGGFIGLSLWIVEIFKIFFNSLKIKEDSIREAFFCIFGLWLVMSITGGFYTSYITSLLGFMYIGYAEAYACSGIRQVYGMGDMMYKKAIR